ncbi:MAG: Sec-independent protein translocase subunit TatA [Actinomycetales bacterium]|nr:Sec-independent protein translocase subunit TatA [Actinomycetales bacterium]
MFKQIGPLEIVLIFILVMVLFGAKRLPDAARGLGRSLRIFKAETKGLHDTDGAPDAPVAPAVAGEAAPDTTPRAQA